MFYADLYGPPEKIKSPTGLSVGVSLPCKSLSIIITLSPHITKFLLTNSRKYLNSLCKDTQKHIYGTLYFTINKSINLEIFILIKRNVLLELQIEQTKLWMDLSCT